MQSDVTDRMEKLMESLELPTETILIKPISPYTVDVEDYRCDITTRISQAWAIAKEKIGKAQKAQKVQYDKSTKVPTLSVVHASRNARQNKEHSMVLIGS